MLFYLNKFTNKSNKSYSKKLDNKKTKKQTGAGLFSITPKRYTNIKYGKSGNITPELICIQCKNNVFRHHKQVTESRMRAAVLGEDVFGKEVNAFTCYKCGFMMYYSGDITYDNKELIRKSSRKSL